jgi:hypothetical protein
MKASIHTGSQLLFAVAAGHEQALDFQPRKCPPPRINRKVGKFPFRLFHDLSITIPMQCFMQRSYVLADTTRAAVQLGPIVKERRWNCWWLLTAAILKHRGGWAGLRFSVHPLKWNSSTTTRKSTPFPGSTFHQVSDLEVVAHQMPKEGW